MSADSTKTKLPTVVVEEDSLLTRVRASLAGGRKSYESRTDYDKELVALRDAIAEAHQEDIAPLVEHMTRIQSLAAQRGLGDEIPVDSASPYFGHLRLDENNEMRDVLLGKHTYLLPDSGISIVDWRNAPVSRMYYLYDEDDEYEEEFGGKTRRGRISARRSVTIKGGELNRIAAPDALYTKRGGKWLTLDPVTSKLAGGQGVSIRAEGLAPVRGTLGVDADGSARKDKHLPEIAALLDKRQFELISSPAAGLVIIEGGAGSGKTTVGLHRIAYLAFQEPKRFIPSRMMVVVLNEGLAAYISRVLPALGVTGVNVTTFTRWSMQQRKRHISGLPYKHSDSTPSVVSRLKKHPAMLRILDDVVDRLDERLSKRFLDDVSGTPSGNRAQAAWRGLSKYPLNARRFRMMRWIKGEVSIGEDAGREMHPRTVVAAEQSLSRMEKHTSTVVSDWAELLTDRDELQRAFDLNAPSEFTNSELDVVHSWCVGINSGLHENDPEEPSVIDGEDEAILLRLHQLKVGWLRGRSGRLLYDHLMMDEAQDFSPVEVAVMMGTMRRGDPVTIAGDTAQKIVRESGFVSWEELLADIGVQGRRIPPLEVAYRSTAEIMRLSQDVLGPFAGEPPKAVRHGAPVELHRFSDPGQAVGFLAEALRDLAVREPSANVAIIARHLGQARTYYQGLEKAEIPRLNIVAVEDFSFGPGVEATEVHQVKGLEFDYVILVDVNADSYPDNEDSRHLLHVAATRAAHQLWIVSTGTPSPILPAWLLKDENQ